MTSPDARYGVSPFLLAPFFVLLAACSSGQGEEPAGPSSIHPRLMPANVPPVYAATPHGFFHPSCMAEVKPGETVLGDGSVRTASGELRTVDACGETRFDPTGQAVTTVSAAQAPKPLPEPGSTNAYNGWIESYNTTSTGALSRLSATWVVPPAPSNPNDGQVIYLFNGLEGVPTVESILQPVLGFANGQWTATSWNCCKAGTTYHGNTINVSPGDLIVGTVNGTGCDSGSGLCNDWSIETLDQNTGEAAVLNTSAWGVAENWVFAGVLEVYGVSSCDDLPASGQVAFNNQAYSTVSGANAAANWQLGLGSVSPACGYGGTVQGSSVTLDFTAAGPGPGGVAVGGSYAFQTLVNATSCMDVQADSSANLTQIEEYACNGTTAQTFTVVDAGNGLVNLRHPHSGKCVDLYQAGTANGTTVELYDCNGGVAQQFAVQTDAGGNVTFRNPNSGRCLDVSGSNPANLTKVQLWDCNGANAQKWTPLSGGLSAGASHAFHTQVNPSSCLDVYADSGANFTQIDEYTCNGTAAQQFTAVPTGNGLVSLRHPGSGKCVDLYAAGTSDGTKVELYDCNGTPAQQFLVESDASGNLTFRNLNSDRCLDLSGSNPANLTKVQLWDCNGSNAQKWQAAAN
jgi:hypothetical protein